jgi:hypothetical protein
MTRPAARFWIMHIALAVALGAAAMSGMLDVPSHGTVPYVVAVISAAVLWGVWRAATGDWDSVEWIGERVVMLGLIGTNIGFIATFAGLGSAAADTSGAIAAVSAGMATSLYATLLGIAGSLWLQVVHRVVAR